EVGTTNRTRAADYDRAIGPETALLLRVHQSNFRVVGFTEQPRLEELVRIGRTHGIPVVDDLGSGVLVELEGEPSARDALSAGAEAGGAARAAAARGGGGGRAARGAGEGRAPAARGAAAGRGGGGGGRGGRTRGAGARGGGGRGGTRGCGGARGARTGASTRE